MNSIITFPTTQSLLNSSNKPFTSSQISLKFKTTHVNTSHISIRPRKITTKASAQGSMAPAAEKETLYDLLGISENGTLAEIKHAYKKMALKYHPDVSPTDRVEEYTMRFFRVQEAYETLSDPEARSMYDRCLAKGFGFSGKRETRFDPRSDDMIMKRWKETWMGQISELQWRTTVKQATGMSWAARIRKQRGKPFTNGSDPVQ